MQSGCIAAIGRGSRNGLQTAGAEAYSMITREQIRKLAGYSYSRGGRYLAAGQDQALSDKNYEKRQADSGGRQREREKSL